MPFSSQADLSDGVHSATPYLYQVDTAADKGFTLDPNREYTILHSGFNDAGSATTEAVFYGEGMPEDAGGPTVTASFASGANKGIISAGGAVVVGPLRKYVTLRTPTAKVVVTILTGEMKRIRR